VVQHHRMNPESGRRATLKRSTGRRALVQRMFDLF